AARSAASSRRPSDRLSWREATAGFEEDGDAAMITLYDHPLSPYAQKVRVALREKGLAFQLALPGGLGAGGAGGEFAEANPRAEVPVLIDQAARVFDSTIILEYLEDAYPT